MMTKKIIFSFITLSLFITATLHAGHNKKHDMTNQTIPSKNQTIPSKNEIIVKVDGIVCSFCAYGTEKTLSKINFIDKSHFGGDGILVEIEQGLVKIRIKETKEADFEELIKAITKGGYMAKEISFWATGLIIQTKSGFMLKKTNYPYDFQLLNFDKIDLKKKQVTLLANHKISKKFPLITDRKIFQIH